MNEQDKKQFAVIMYWLADKFLMKNTPRVLSKDDMRDYFYALNDIHIARIEWASRYIFGHNQYFPKPVEIRNAANMAPATVVPALPTKEPTTLIGEVLLPEERERLAQENRAKIRALLAELDEKFGDIEA
jgi:hypothetical protein